MTTEEHRVLAQTSQLGGSICAVLSIALGLAGVYWTVIGRWEGLAALAAAGWLLHSANTSFRDADQHNSHAAAKQAHA